MNQWIYEKKDNLLVFVGESQAIFIKVFHATNEYIMTIENSAGTVLVQLTGFIHELSPELQQLCTI
jgi:hypothetical protein